MVASDLVNLSGLMDNAKCFALVRQHRWPESVCCPGCGRPAVIRDGCDDTQPHRQRYHWRCQVDEGGRVASIRLAKVSRSQGDADHLTPCLKGGVACGSIRGGGQAATAELEVVVDPAVGGKETLRVAR